MSYILDALRKADAERERESGAVPDLHAQLIPLTAGRGADAVERSSTRWWVGLAIAGVVLLGLLAWWWFGAGRPAASVAPAGASLPAASAPVAATAAAPASTAASAALEAPGAPPGEAKASVPAASASVPTSVQAKVVPAPAAKSTAVPPTPASAVPKPVPKVQAAQRPPPASAAAAAVPAAATAARPATPPTEARVPGLTELPEELRRQVPTMMMGGSVYSPEPARRMVIVNGQVFGEGSVLAPELILEKINPKSAVFSIRGQRFQVPL